MKRQYGVLLIYKSGTERLEGEETEIIFKLLKRMNIVNFLKDRLEKIEKQQ